MNDRLTAWLAPEVNLGSPPNLASDIYGWGKVISEMVKRSHPRDEHVENEIRNKLQELSRQCMGQDSSARPIAADVTESIMTLSTEAEDDEGLFSAMITTGLDDEAKEEKEKWRMIPCARELRAVFDQSADFVYLKTPQIDGSDEQPLKQLSFDIKGHDQGREATSTFSDYSQADIISCCVLQLHIHVMEHIHG
jgi:hypothetical protein